MAELPVHPPGIYDRDADFLASIGPNDLVYFALHVGNGDTQLLVLPERQGTRHMVVVDVATSGKLPDLIRDLSIPTGDPEVPALLDEHSRIRVVVASHPHQDHVGGFPDFLERCGSLLEGGGEVWDPAYFTSNAAWQGLMQWLEVNPQVGRLHPTAGTTRFFDDLTVTALSPSMRLRNQYDTYGVYTNDASIALRLEFPVKRAFTAEPGDNTRPLGRIDRGMPGGTTRLILGADAQTQSWSHVAVDFPPLDATNSPAYEALKLASGTRPLSATLFKVPHHASKKGLNYELAEHIQPSVSIVPCDPSVGRHGFPHAVAQAQLREAIDHVASSGGTHPPDWDPSLNIHYTGDRVAAGDDGAGDGDSAVELGTIAVVLSPGSRWQLWRFLDGRRSSIELERLRSAFRLAR